MHVRHELVAVDIHHHHMLVYELYVPEQAMLLYLHGH